jgi:hypothetical protein
VAHHILRVVEDCAWMNECVEVDNFVVGGRQPHGILLFIDDERQPRDASRGAGQSRT